MCCLSLKIQFLFYPDSSLIKTQLQLIKKTKADIVDKAFEIEHHDVFKDTDCLTCANCCKSYSPIISLEDLYSISVGASISVENLLKEYIEMDEEGDFVFRMQPCPFLNLNDNKCKIYEHRPSACKDYPHTNRKKIKSALDAIEINASTCPAVYTILNNVYSRIND